MTSPEALLEVALRIGRRMASQARWSGGACTWQVRVPDREGPDPRKGTFRPASGVLYQGTAGISLFLTELFRATGDDEIARAAEGAVRHALSEGAGLPATSFGFHTGRVGIAYAAARAGEVLGRPEWTAGAERVLTPLAGNERHDAELDVIGGAAGAIPALLRLSTRLDPALTLAVARRLGDHLMDRASREVHGWSWGVPRPNFVRNLNGLAHGAAGVGHALLELYHATGEAPYRYGAEQAFLYERRWLDREADNWPDFRHGQVGEYLTTGRLEILKARVAAGETLPPYETSCMSAWCHGAPGIGLTRLRAWELLGEPVYREEAEAAVRTTLRSLAKGGNYSLCHGLAGNCETLLHAAEALGDESLRGPVLRCALRGWEEIERAGRPWPCGTLGGEADPSLFLGEAGIGYFYLRLAAPGTPSVLLLTAASSAGQTAAGSGCQEVREQYVDAFFGRTLRRFERLGVRADPLRACAGRPVAAGPPIPAVHDAVAERIRAEGDPVLRERMEDAFRLDRAAYEAALVPADGADEFLRGLRRLPAAQVEWERVRVRLSPRVRLVWTEWDWDAWDGGPAGGEPERGEAFYLLQQTAGRVQRRRIRPLTAQVLDAVRTPGTLAGVAARVAEALGGVGEGDHPTLETIVKEQLVNAYTAGLVECEPEGTPAARQHRPALAHV